MAIKFVFGNLHELVKNPKPSQSNSKTVNSHRWVMFVSLAADKEKTVKFVKSVTYHLHPTFNPNVIKIDQAPFLIARVGWGYFEIHLVIEF